MSFPSKRQLAAALALSGFEGWRPKVDVPDLNRPISRPNDLPGSGRVAAVMVLIYPGESVELPMLVLTQRKSNLSQHASQISFPGGSKDAGESLRETALRETQEEIGVPGSEIEVLGQLNSVYIPPSDFEVTPFVGWHPGSPRFIRSEEEVEQIIQVPVSDLLDPATLEFGDVRSNGRLLNVPFYRVGSYQVWGATAIMLGELIERLARLYREAQGGG